MYAGAIATGEGGFRPPPPQIRDIPAAEQLERELASGVEEEAVAATPIRVLARDLSTPTPRSGSDWPGAQSQQVLQSRDVNQITQRKRKKSGNDSSGRKAKAKANDRTGHHALASSIDKLAHKASEREAEQAFHKSVKKTIAKLAKRAGWDDWTRFQLHELLRKRPDDCDAFMAYVDEPDMHCKWLQWWAESLEPRNDRLCTNLSFYDPSLSEPEDDVTNGNEDQLNDEERHLDLSDEGSDDNTSIASD